jgi:hypothetical protein
MGGLQCLSQIDEATNRPLALKSAASLAARPSRRTRAEIRHQRRTLPCSWRLQELARWRLRGGGRPEFPGQRPWRDGGWSSLDGGYGGMEVVGAPAAAAGTTLACVAANLAARLSATATPCRALVGGDRFLRGRASLLRISAALGITRAMASALTNRRWSRL